MGTAIAQIEGCPIVPNTPSEHNELVAEITELYHELQVEMVLFGITATVDVVQAEPNAQAHLLVLNAETRRLEVKSYKADEMAKASEEYLGVEQYYADNPRVQAVLVSVDSLATLQSAYPNYYLDTRDFLDVVRRVIGVEVEGEQNGKDAGDATKN